MNFVTLPNLTRLHGGGGRAALWEICKQATANNVTMFTSPSLEIFVEPDEMTEYERLVIAQRVRS